jgi:carbonic anhydrase
MGQKGDCDMTDKKLIFGYQTFRAQHWPRFRELYERLTRDGQKPKAMILACADSRVDPATIFSAAPGDLFVCRNVANIVPPYASDRGLHSTEAGLEFAVNGLKVEHIVLMGHGQCGGIEALLQTDALEGEPPTEFIHRWVALAAPALRLVLEKYKDRPRRELQLLLEEENIRLGLSRLMTYPFIRQRIESGEMALHGWHFSVADGILMRLNPETDCFEPVR